MYKSQCVEQRISDALIKILDLNDAEVYQQSPDAVLRQHWNHLIEEVGEIALCFRGRNDEPISNEAVDVAICALAIALLCNDGNVGELCDVLELKLEKWKNNLEK